LRYYWVVLLLFFLLWAFWQYGAKPVRTQAPGEAVSERPVMDFMDIARSIAPSVVAVEAETAAGQPYGENKRSGSGLVIDSDGLVLTNRHIVERATALTVNMRDGRRFEAVYYRPDEELDIAIVKIDASGLPAAELGSSSGLRVGQWAIVCGNPFSPLVIRSEPAISIGIISGLNRDLGVDGGVVYRNLIQTDAAINLGSSGGPLLDLSGKVVGITAAIVSASGANEGMGFAIPINDIIPRLEALRSAPSRLRL